MLYECDHRMNDRSPEPLEFWIGRLLDVPRMLGQGHGAEREGLNLGLGWLYYGLARALRPSTVVVIGSLRGFVPLVLGRALAENGDSARLHFIDPSLVDDFWKSDTETARHFADFGVDNIAHHCQTTQEFVASDAHRQIDGIGLLFIDGHHTAEQARFDYEAFVDRLDASAIVLFHDTARIDMSTVYGADRPYLRTVKQYTDELKSDAALQVFDLPLFSGVTLVRRA